MRALNSWLKAVRADGLVLVRTRVAGPWGFAVQPRDAGVFHFVAEGRAFVRQPGAETIRAGSRAHPRGTRTCVDTSGSRPRSWLVACSFRAQLQRIGG